VGDKTGIGWTEATWNPVNRGAIVFWRAAITSEYLPSREPAVPTGLLVKYLEADWRRSRFVEKEGGAIDKATYWPEPSTPMIVKKPYCSIRALMGAFGKVTAPPGSTRN
jgi:hypothetical protein